MRARLILEGQPEEGVWPPVVEVVAVETEAGESLEVAAFACPSRAVAAHHLGRESEGRPLFLYTRSEEDR